jgi:hypothetical protein
MLPFIILPTFLLLFLLLLLFLSPFIFLFQGVHFFPLQTIFYKADQIMPKRAPLLRRLLTSVCTAVGPLPVFHEGAHGVTRARRPCKSWRTGTVGAHESVDVDVLMKPRTEHESHGEKEKKTAAEGF